MHATGAPARYVQTMMLGGKPYARPWLPLDAIAGGATLDVELDASPSQWGSTEAPPSYGPGDFGAVADAYNVLADIEARRRTQGWWPVGRKIGFTNTTIWPRYGVHQPIWAHVWAHTVRYAPDGRATLSLRSRT